jgi:hypothetical protein
MSNIILTDIDGCTSEWLNAFKYWMEKEHGEVMSEVQSFDLLVKYPKLEPKQVFACIEEFNHSEIIARLIPTNDSHQVINSLNADGYKFIAITSLSDNPIALANRTANLQTYFGDSFIDIICLKTGANKTETLAKYTDALCWVEDHPKNADAGVELGIHSFLITQPHNVGQETKATRIDSWKDIARWLKTF